LQYREVTARGAAGNPALPSDAERRYDRELDERRVPRPARGIEVVMITLKNILVATDFSETSTAAFAYARQFARTFKAKLHVLHVAGNVFEAAIGTEMYAADFAGMQQDVEDTARQQLELVVAPEDRRTLDVATVLRTSNMPAYEIVAYAVNANIDLIVLGTHGRSGMSHFLLGSVAERVVRTASCPVLTVRGTAPAAMVLRAEQVTAHA
jgi:nucleotide-binding universal stress UspA family protein